MNLFGDGDEIFGGGIAKFIAFMIGAENLKEGIIADGDAQSMQGQPAANVYTAIE